MDSILYKQSCNSDILHSHLATNGLNPDNGTVPTSEISPTKTTYYSIQNSYLPVTSSQDASQLLPTTTTPSALLDSSSPLSQPQSPTESNDHCTTDSLISQASDTLGTQRTGQQKCTRCKRWKILDQFSSGGPNPQIFVGCLECRETAKKYGQSEYGKATRRSYNQTTKAKETRKKYAQSEKGKESRKKYAQTKRAKETRKKYNQSEKAKAARRKRALVKSGRMKEDQQGNEKENTTTTFDIAHGFTNSITFDPSQEVLNDKMNPMVKAFWQTVTKTMYDQARRHCNNDMNDGHDKFEVDIQLKYRRTR